MGFLFIPHSLETENCSHCEHREVSRHCIRSAVWELLWRSWSLPCSRNTIRKVYFSCPKFVPLSCRFWERSMKTVWGTQEENSSNPRGAMGSRLHWCGTPLLSTCLTCHLANVFPHTHRIFSHGRVAISIDPHHRRLQDPCAASPCLNPHLPTRGRRSPPEGRNRHILLLRSFVCRFQRALSNCSDKEKISPFANREMIRVRKLQFPNWRKTCSEACFKLSTQTTPCSAPGLFCSSHAFEKASVCRLRWLAADHSEFPSEATGFSEPCHMNGIEGFWLTLTAKFILFPQHRIEPVSKQPSGRAAQKAGKLFNRTHPTFCSQQHTA